MSDAVEHRIVPLDIASAICGVKPGTIYRWVSENKITATEGPDGKNWYFMAELLRRVDDRHPDALLLRAGVFGEHAKRMSRAAVDKRKNRVSSLPRESVS